MLEEKRELIKKLSEVSLTTRDFIRIVTSEEYNNLCKYYDKFEYSYNMALNDVFDNIDGIYVNGDIRSLYSTISGTEIRLDISEKDPSIYVSVDNCSMLKDIKPEDSVEIMIDLPFDSYINDQLLFKALKIKKRNKRVTPISICPKCKSLYRPNDMIITIYKDMKNQTQSEYDNIHYCSNCCTESEQVELKEIWDSDILYEIYNK